MKTQDGSLEQDLEDRLMQARQQRILMKVIKILLTISFIFLFICIATTIARADINCNGVNFAVQEENVFHINFQEIKIQEWNEADKRYYFIPLNSCGATDYVEVQVYSKNKSILLRTLKVLIIENKQINLSPNNSPTRYVKESNFDIFRLQNRHLSLGGTFAKVAVDSALTEDDYLPTTLNGVDRWQNIINDIAGKIDEIHSKIITGEITKIREDQFKNFLTSNAPISMRDVYSIEMVEQYLRNLE